MSKAIVVFVFVSFLSCTTKNNLKHEVSKIEKELHIEYELNDISINDRLKNIKKVIKYNNSKKQKVTLFGSKKKDTVEFDNEVFKAAFVLALVDTVQTSYGVVKVNNEVDTLLYYKEDGIYGLTLKPYKKGKNEYNGYIYHSGDSTKHYFSGHFYAE